VFFLDADAVIRNVEFPLEALFALMGRDKLLAVRMENSIEKWMNTGAMLIRNTRETHNMLRKWLALSEFQHPFGEQGALPCMTSRDPEFAGHTLVLPPDHNWMLLQNMPRVDRGSELGSQWILHGATSHKSSFCQKHAHTAYGEEVYRDWFRMVGSMQDVAERTQGALNEATFWESACKMERRT